MAACLEFVCEFDKDLTAFTSRVRNGVESCGVGGVAGLANRLHIKFREGFGAFLRVCAGGSRNSHRRRSRRGGRGRRRAGRRGAGRRRAARRAGLGWSRLSAGAVAAPRQGKRADSTKRDNSGSHVTGQNSPHLDPYGADLSQQPGIESTDLSLSGHLAIHRQRRHRVQRTKGVPVTPGSSSPTKETGAMQVGRTRIAPGPSCTPLWVSPRQSVGQPRSAGHPFGLTERSQCLPSLR